MKNILITSAGKRVALVRAFKETVQALDPSIRIYCTDMNPEMAPVTYISDKCFCVPRVTDAVYPAELLKLCVDNNVGLVIPTIDTELAVLASCKDRFSGYGIKVIVSDSGFVQICRDKRKTNLFFEGHGIRIPRPVDKLNPVFPLFAKPYDGSLSTNIHVIRYSDELTQEILDDPKLIFMEYVDKTVYKEFTVDMYYGIDNRVKCIIPRERIEVRAGEINKGRTVRNELVGFLKGRLDHIDGCIGCICIQLFYNHRTGDIIGIEINPRFGGGYPLSYMAGGNYPEYLVREYFFGEELAYGDNWKDNMLMLRYDDAVFV